MSYFKIRSKALGHALAGLRAAFGGEPHVKLHVFIAGLVLAAGWWCGLSATEWFMILACITLVVCLELFNSALEKLCNLVMPQQHPAVKYIKDVAAGAVLLACIFSVIIGLMVFLPHFKN